MASTITAASLTVTTTESITLNGSNMGATNTLTIASVNEINQRVVTVDSGNVRTLFNFGGTIGAGEFVRANVKYLRITNKDDTNTACINIRGNATNCWVEVEAGGNFVLTTGSSMMQADDDTSVVTPVLEDLNTISAYSASGADLDCYVALT